MIDMIFDDGPIINDERRGLPSASGMERIALCPGSWRAEINAPPEEESEYAVEGTMLHNVLAGTLADDDLTDEQQWIVSRCRQIEAEVLEAVGVDLTYTEREVRLWSQTGDAVHYSGKPDAMYWDGRGRAVVIDYKTGRGEIAPAERNQQMRALAVLAAAHTESTDSYVALVHPRYRAADGQPATIARYGSDDLDMARAEIAASLDAALNIDAPRVPGPAQCRYCKAKAICPEARETALTLLPQPMSIEDLPATLATLTGEEYATILPQLATAKKIITAIESAARKYIADGNAIPGYRVGEGKERRNITDPQAAYSALADVLTPEQFAACCSVALGKLEKVLKSATGATAAATKEMINTRLASAIETKETRGSLESANEIPEEVTT